MGELDGASLGETLELLKTSEIDGMGLHPEGSNYVFIVRLKVDDGLEPIHAMYKPRSGERPLRDFPAGTLYKRETASFELSAALGWPRIPPTVIREGPHGIGSVQLFIDAQPDGNYFSLRESMLANFEEIALFDLITNNADRKGGAVLQDDAGKIWAIDHGLTFNPYARLRTVMWEFCGEEFSPALIEDLKSFRALIEPGRSMAAALGELIDDDEVAYLAARIDNVIEDPVFPVLDPDLNVPWPVV
ncbi:MAG: SCO1664 family protein [Chloroflexi bacterium]|nr:SCO1664 family protein [Chloroflexota bacterium]